MTWQKVPLDVAYGHERQQMVSREMTDGNTRDGR